MTSTAGWMLRPPSRFHLWLLMLPQTRVLPVERELRRGFEELDLAGTATNELANDGPLVLESPTAGGYLTDAQVKSLHIKLEECCVGIGRLREREAGSLAAVVRNVRLPAFIILRSCSSSTHRADRCLFASRGYDEGIRETRGA